MDHKVKGKALKCEEMDVHHAPTLDISRKASFDQKRFDMSLYVNFLA